MSSDTAGLTQGQSEHLTALTMLLDRGGLLELRGIVDDRLAELERQGVEDCLGGQEAPAEAQGGRRGYIELKMVRGHGPYAYRRWREAGKLKSRYLGKVAVREQVEAI